MVSQVVAILLLLLGQNGAEPFLQLGQIALWVVVATSLLSAYDYYRAYISPAPRSAPRLVDTPPRVRQPSKRRNVG
jgi:phosphatidylglycerophosphate synthase